MADLSITPVATQIQPPKVNLGDILNMAKGVQAYKQAKLINPLLAQQQQTITKQTQLGLQSDKFFKILDAATSEINDPDIVAAARNPEGADRQKLADALRKRAEDTGKALGLSQEEIDVAVNPSIQVALTDPGNLQRHLQQSLMQSLSAQGRVSALTPQGAAVTGFAPTGEKVTQQVNVNPFGGGMGAPMQGTVSFAGPGTTMTPTGRTDPQGNPTAMVTDARTGAVREVTIPAGMGGAPLQPPATGPGAGAPPAVMTAPIEPGAGAAGAGVGAGLPPPPPGAPANYSAPTRLTAGQAGMLETNIDIAKKDWQQVQFENAGAQPRIASFEKIKSLVPEAFTGVGGEQKKFASGVLQAIGVPANIAETSSTEELAKNSAILNLAGGNTDAARQIAELATPGTKMTKEGILRVTNQLIGLERMKQSKSQFLAPYANDAAKYIEVKQNFDRYADPRFFQEASPEEVAKMKAAMSPKEREEFLNKLQRARQLGII